jgi:predicted nucleotidyltransferase
MSITSDNNDWQWRFHKIEEIAARIDPKKYGIKGFYLFGSTKNATAGPCSDIDILIHFCGSEKQKKKLQLFFNKWSQQLAKKNFRKTGCKSNGLLDVHLVTDEDINQQTSWAVHIGAITNPARRLRMKGEH